MSQSEEQRVLIFDALKEAGVTAAGSRGAFHMKLPDKPVYPSLMFGLSPNRQSGAKRGWRLFSHYWTVWCYVEKGANGSDAEGLAEIILTAARSAIAAKFDGLASVSEPLQVKPAIEMIAGKSIHRRGFEIEIVQ